MATTPNYEKRAAHMTRKTMETKSQVARRWITSHVKSRRGYKPLKGSRLG